MPTPTSAAWIIATSFPPSPIDKVTEPVNAFIASTTYAFWVGEHRQQITDGALVETFINYYKNYPNAIANDYPSMTNTALCLLPNWLSKFYKFSSSASLITNISYYGDLSPVDIAIH